MKLRTFALASTAALATLSLVTAGSLMLGTSTIDREVVHISVTIEDVRSIEKLKSQLLTHEREIAVAFNDMLVSLEEQRQQQLGMLASVAHDLKNPLAALKLTVDHVRSDRPLPSEDRLRPMLARIGQQVARCDRMVGDLLQTVRGEGSTFVVRLPSAAAAASRETPAAIAERRRDDGAPGSARGDR